MSRTTDMEAKYPRRRLEVERRDHGVATRWRCSECGWLKALPPLGSFGLVTMRARIGNLRMAFGTHDCGRHRR